jgi:peptide/nickel transport system permease protein
VSAAAPSAEAAGAIDASAATVRRELARELVKSKTFIVGLVVVVFWLVCAVFGRSIAPYSPEFQDLLGVNKPPSSAHWFGTDQIGRDVLSRVLVGSRSVLIISFLATVLGTVAGTIIGLITGYMRGVTDEVISRFVEAILSLPLIITALLVVAALGPSNTTVTISVGLVFTPVIARTVRSAVIQERELEYVAAAHLRNETSPYIMFSELLPNVFPPIMVEFTVRLAYAIFTVATLSFLGLGIQLPTPDWGLDISQNYSQITAGYWWEVLFAAAAIGSLVIGINLVADSIESVLDR